MEPKVVWAEGVFLSQQYFQQFEAYHVEQYRHLHNSLKPYQWGFIQLEIDTTALAMGIFRVLFCECIFPNGQYVAFDASEADLSVSLHSEHSTTNIYLQLADNDKVTGITGYPETKTPTTWRADYQQLSDRYDTNRQQEVLLAKPNLQLTEAQLPGHQQILVARLKQLSNSHYLNDDTYIPAVISLNYPPLRKLVHSCLTILLNIQQHTLQHYQQKSRDAVISAIMFYHVNSHYQHLADLCHQITHPQLVFQAFKRSITGMPLLELTRKTPFEYQHDDIYASFQQVQQRLLHIHQQVMELHYTTSSFSSWQPNIWISEPLDDDTLHHQTIHLRVPATIEDVKALVKRVKIADEHTISKLVNSALSGIPLVKVEAPTWQRQSDFQYHIFSFDQNHPYWQHILKHKRIALYIPVDYQNNNFELVIRTVDT
jgi:type VI secretion system protein ImpJ